MTTFHEQMKHAREFEGRTIRDYPSWTLQDYRDFMFCVEKGYLWQECGGCFIINQEWEGDDIYAEEFLEEEEEKDEEEEGDWWIAHNGNIEFITSTLTKVENMGADEWGLIRSFTDNREKE